MGPSCLKNKAGPQMTINQSPAAYSPAEEPKTQPGWKWLRTLTLGSIAASATPSSHLINSPDLHYSVWRMGEVALTAARNCASTRFQSCLCCLLAVWLWANHSSLYFFTSKRGVVHWYNVLWVKQENSIRDFGLVTLTLRARPPRNTFLSTL